jgi:hypothetical protein
MERSDRTVGPQGASVVTLTCSATLAGRGSRRTERQRRVLGGRGVSLDGHSWRRGDDEAEG